MKKPVQLFIAAAAAAFALCAGAQDAYPTKRIQLVVPFASGNGIDQLAREYAEVLRTELKQPVVVENREGAGGIIGGTVVMRAAPDGYTAMVAAHPPFAIATLLQKTPAFDASSSFEPVARVGAVPLVAVTASSMPFKTWQEMAAYFRAHPDKANYAASGVGSPGQLFTQLIKAKTGLPLQEISYKSTAQALTDVLAGQVQVSLVSVPAAAEHIRTGALRLLAVGSSKRLAAYPDTPTIAELIGQPGFEASVWYGFLMPAGTPAARVNKFYDEIAKASATPRIVEFMARASIVPGLQNPQQFAKSIHDDVETARKMIQVAKLHPE
ncbi:Bug family tripartite tricarboxylate transporter substrate binding protein [Variovorax sp. PBL-E5]|uniref:Bug family tripartite tricarboxylate transporter substrate binding protein n=1 Tax=Variovorax sp. PBL-E5 TaxID=434014 RepID=UPI0013166443|nr:tripartite tricarboxylate transporter substrate binding protein [Variovorax sp. PBL-E5]VTU30678.1 Argininosuccinate lyase [Variovorax sp. PBL-E5]